MSIQTEIDKWLASPAGKKKVEAVLGTGKESGYGARRAGTDGGDSSNYYAQRLIEILDAEISEAGFRFGEYLYWIDEGYNSVSRQRELFVNFKAEEISRPSLAPALYRDGAYDIVALMNHGYRAGGSVHGEWHGKDTWSLRERKGAFFIQSAIAKFNAKYSGAAHADYCDKY